MTPAERNAGMADCSLSGLMQAAMQDQEAAVAEARRAALEEAAQWHEKQAALFKATAGNVPSSLYRYAVLEAEGHHDCADAIRALKEQEPTT